MALSSCWAAASKRLVSTSSTGRTSTTVDIAFSSSLRKKDLSGLGLLEEQALSGFDQGQAQQRAEPLVAQAQLAGFTEALTGLFKAALVKGDQAGQQHR